MRGNEKTSGLIKLKLHTEIKGETLIRQTDGYYVCNYLTLSGLWFIHSALSNSPSE